LHSLRKHLKELEQPLNQSIQQMLIRILSTCSKGRISCTIGALSMTTTIKDTIRSRRIAILTADGVDEKSLTKIQDNLVKQGAVAEVIASV
jgi:catalase